MENYKISNPDISAEQENIEMTIRAKKGKEIIGYIKGRVNSILNCVECDTAVAPEYRGQGIASALLKSMLERVFKDKMLDSMCYVFGKGTETQFVVLNIDAENFSSRHVAEKMGFVIVDSNARDSVDYAISKKQYLKNVARQQVVEKTQSQGFEA